MTTPRRRTICATPHEAAGLHEGRISLIVRPVKPQPHESCSEGGCGWHWHPKGSEDRYLWDDTLDGLLAAMADRCPFGRVGDVLEFREAFRGTEGLPSTLQYRASYIAADMKPPKGWKSAAQMPRWAIRTRRTILDVRVGPVREITRDEAMETGVERVDPYDLTPELPPGMCACWKNYKTGGWFAADPKASLRSLYESRHGEGSWSTGFAWLITVGA